MTEANPTLQPLRVPGGWKIEVNELRELDPSPDTIDWFYGSILFSAVHRRSGYELHARWEPEGEPAGRFVLQRYILKFEAQGDGVLEGYLVDEQKFQHRRDLVERLEKVMLLNRWV